MRLRELTRCALFAAVIALCAWLAVPFGEISITMQTFGVLLALGVLGGKGGCIACGVYLLLGSVGVPVFSGFRGGMGMLLGPAGGYLWGFLLGAAVYWLLQKQLPRWVCMVLCLLTCYTCGTLWYALTCSPEGLWVVVLKCVVPYLLPDAVKLICVLPTARRLRHIMTGDRA